MSGEFSIGLGVSVQSELPKYAVITASPFSKPHSAASASASGFRSGWYWPRKCTGWNACAKEVAKCASSPGFGDGRLKTTVVSSGVSTVIRSPATST